MRWCRPVGMRKRSRKPYRNRPKLPEVALDGLFVNVLGLQGPGLNLARNGAHGVGQLGVAAVVQAEVDDALVVVLSQIHHVVHSVQHALLQALAAAAEQHLAAALVHFVGDGAEVVGKQVHQIADLFRIAGEVLCGKDVQRQHKDASVAHGVAGDLAQAVKPGLVAQADRHQALFGPAAVTVHDDSDMGGEAGSSILRHGGFSPSIVCFVSDFGRLRTQHLGRLLIRVVGTPV